MPLHGKQQCGWQMRAGVLAFVHAHVWTRDNRDFVCLCLCAGRVAREPHPSSFDAKCIRPDALGRMRNPTAINARESITRRQKGQRGHRDTGAGVLRFALL